MSMQTNDSPDDGAGAGALPGRAADAWSTARRCRCSPACSRSSATATSRASAKRCTAHATHCRPTARTTSRRWRTRRSPTPRRCKRRRFMACTTSIGPGATNMVTAAALAHVNRLPVLLLPGDIFASRRPDPVLQQVEDFGDPTVTANDCFRPVSRYWDRIMRPEQLLRSLPQAMSRADRSRRLRAGHARAAAGRAGGGLGLSARVLRAAHCTFRRSPAPTARQLAAAADLLARAKRPLIIAGGGVHYARRLRRAGAVRDAPRHSGRRDAGRQGRAALGSSAATSARSASPARPPRTRSPPRPTSIIAVGTRLQDFTTGSHTLFQNPQRASSRSTSAGSTPSRAARSPCRAMPRAALAELDALLGEPRGRALDSRSASSRSRAAWHDAVDAATAGRRRQAADGRAGAGRRQPRDRPRTARSSAPPAVCPASCTSCGARRTAAAITSSTATRAWATRSPAASA